MWVQSWTVATKHDLFAGGGSCLQFVNNVTSVKHDKAKHDKMRYITLTNVAQWVGHHPANQKVASSIPGQGTCLGCVPGPGWKCARGN